jgi:hypothetical protein
MKQWRPLSARHHYSEWCSRAFHEASGHEVLPLTPPSLKTLLGVTKVKKEIKKELGITALLKPLR